jgi:hypothetical protein
MTEQAPASEASRLLQRRLESLFVDRSGVDLSIANVSEGEYALFARESEQAGQPRRPDHCLDELGSAPGSPVTGIRFADAKAFCEWLGERAAALAAPPAGRVRYRLPTPTEAQVALPGLEDSLAGLDPRATPTWCLADPPVMSSPPPQAPAALQAYLQALFRFEMLLTHHLNLEFYQGSAMPGSHPDWDYRREKRDRSWVAGFASTLARAQKVLLQVAAAAELPATVTAGLDFDVWQEFRPTAPYLEYLSAVWDAYHRLCKALRPRHGPAVFAAVQLLEQELSNAIDVTLKIRQDCERAQVRILEAPLDLELYSEALRKLMLEPARDPPERERYDPEDGPYYPPVELRLLIGELEALLTRRFSETEDLSVGSLRFAALKAAQCSRNERRRPEGLFRRLFRKETEPPLRLGRDRCLELYCALIVLAARRTGDAPAWEGLRLVREPLP